MLRPKWWPEADTLTPRRALEANCMAATRTPAPPVQRCARCSGSGRVACARCGTVFAPVEADVVPDTRPINAGTSVPATSIVPLKVVVDTARRQAITNALAAHSGNVAAAARALGVHRNIVTYWRKRLT